MKYRTIILQLILLVSILALLIFLDVSNDAESKNKKTPVIQKNKTITVDGRIYVWDQSCNAYCSEFPL